MTLLFGANTPTTGTDPGAFDTSKAYTRNAGVADIAVASGVITSLNMYLESPVFASQLYLAAYDTAGNRICGGQTTPVAGLNTVPIANGPTVIAGHGYYPVAQVFGGSVFPVNDGTAFHRNLIVNSILPLPPTLVFPGNNINGGRMTLWAEGTVVGQSLFPPKRRRSVFFTKWFPR